jgi:hypothetical protein
MTREKPRGDKSAEYRGDKSAEYRGDKSAEYRGGKENACSANSNRNS